MPQLPNPDVPGQPGVRGRETETRPSDEKSPDRTAPSAAPPGATGRQPQQPGQPARFQENPGDRDEPAKR